MNRFREFVFGEPGWSDYLFRKPPKQPDARTVYLGGVGLITALRGAQTLWGQPPAAYLFTALGNVFVAFWGWVWLLIGVATFVVSLSGHKHPDWDRLAAFTIMSLWFTWGAIYLVSSFLAPDDDRRTTDLIAGLVLIGTGIVLAAGVVQGLRKSQEIWLRQRTEETVRELGQGLLKMAKENEELRAALGQHDDGES